MEVQKDTSQLLYPRPRQEQPPPTQQNFQAVGGTQNALAPWFTGNLCSHFPEHEMTQTYLKGTLSDPTPHEGAAVLAPLSTGSCVAVAAGWTVIFITEDSLDMLVRVSRERFASGCCSTVRAASCNTLVAD